MKLKIMPNAYKKTTIVFKVLAGACTILEQVAAKF
ncbi:hypothetical protein SAMN04490355_103626 [Pelosinus propionicus DSM 13327]|uniref:Uncharacterized protein n=1 Tax=Pelosinus propionicus DSM 13327 TaxID=1123291 RepID=A0A1I4MPW7_9FIRM|nr:hypothetical protein SAMN04490355_103626 [Pelosinus propionicus DSM 13327]